VNFTVPAAFVELAEQVILHRAPDRLALLYRILWRLEREPRLIDNPADPDMARARDMAKAVSRAAHKMKAFVRFRQIDDAAIETYAAWFEPAHRVTEATAPFFVRRFTNMDWTILTPDACVAWDRQRLMVSEGADPADAPSEDAQEELWRTYYASIFNPARLNPRQMRQEMPKRYWRNLPEAALIPDLIETAQERARTMVAASPRQPSDRVLKAALRHSRDASYDGRADDDGGGRRRRRRSAGAATCGVTPPRACRAKAPRQKHGTRAADVRRRAAGRPGGPGRTPVRRPRRPDVRQGPGRGRRAPRPGFRHQRREALQARAARQAAHPQDAEPGRGHRLPLVAGRRAAAGAAPGDRDAGRDGGAGVWSARPRRSAPTAASPCSCPTRPRAW
jgi:probable DNA metabolism protein